MSGHSRWANIKHKKEKADKQKGKLFSRIMKEIISAVKQKGPDPKSNSKLKVAIEKAKAANIPNDSIERNIKKASSADQGDYSEITYEFYGHGGVGIIVEAMTDNKNRLASDFRIAINKCGGTIANPGSVSFNFEKKGIIKILKKDALEDELFTIVSDAGAEDFDSNEDIYIIITEHDHFLKVKDSIDKNKIPIQEATLEMIPKTYVECSQEDYIANNKLIDWLENIDDVDALFHNQGQGIAPDPSKARA
jgi:YebC/PmpR family DNA-binding regulatory protein